LAILGNFATFWADKSFYQFYFLPTITTKKLPKFSTPNATFGKNQVENKIEDIFRKHF